MKPSNGSVIVDGTNIDEIIKPWQQSLGYVGQEIFLMDDTIKANIAFGVIDQEININNIYKQFSSICILLMN